jgi:hypothetical protein
MRSFIRPAAVKIGIAHIGWHTFRHTYSTLLGATKADIKVMQELLRHASSRVTLDTYTQAVTIHKRRAQSRSFASFAHLRLQPPDLTELHVPFCAYKNSSGCPKTLAIGQTGPEIGDGVVPFCACAKSVRSP